MSSSSQGAMGKLVRFLRATPAAAGAAPLYVDPDGTPQPFHFRFPTFATTLANGSSLVRLLMPGSERRLRDYRMLDEDFSKPRTVPQPSASCLLLRRSCLPPRRGLRRALPDLLQRRPARALAGGPRASTMGDYPMRSSRTKRTLQRAGSAVRAAAVSTSAHRFACSRTPSRH